MPEKPAPASWPLPASRWPTALSLPKGVAGQPVAETEQGIRRIGPASVMGLGLALRLRPCSAAAAVNSRPSSGTPTSRSMMGRRSPRHSLPTASAAASPASSPVIPLSDKPVPSAVRRCRTTLVSRSSPGFLPVQPHIPQQLPDGIGPNPLRIQIQTNERADLAEPAAPSSDRRLRSVR